MFTSGYVNTETILHFFNNKKSKNKIFDRHTHIPGKSKMLNGPRYDAFFFSSHVIIYPVSRSKVKKRKTDSIYFNSFTSLNHNAEEPKPGA